ncbi:MAG: hypothetical protein ACLU7D_01565 [Collinsella sp.]
MFRERLLASKDKETVTQEIQKSAPARRPEDIIRDPYVLEFLGFSDDAAFPRESDLRAGAHHASFRSSCWSLVVASLCFVRAVSASPLMDAISILTLFFTTI